MWKADNYSYIYSSGISIFSSSLEIEAIDISETIEYNELSQAKDQEKLNSNHVFYI